MTPWRFAVAIWTIWAAAQIFLTGADVAAGDLGDTDNHMRLAQLRDFLAGQNWFDVRQHRFVGAEGGAMHFSRLPDLYFAGLYLATYPFIGPVAAEAFVLLVGPPLLLLLLLAAAASAAERIGGVRAAFAAVILIMLTPSVTFQFAPGRVDHHGLALVLSVTAFASLSVSWEKPKFAALAAIFALAAAAVSLETAPVFAALFVALAVAWIRSGKNASFAAAGFASLVASPIILGVTLGPAEFADAHCDAFAFPAALAFTSSGALALGLSYAPIRSARMRLVSAIAGGLSIAACGALLFPNCFSGPFEGMDPVVRDIWLTSVTEAKSPGALFRENPEALITYYGFPFAALLVAGISVARRREEFRIEGLGSAVIFLAFSMLLLAAAVRGASLASLFAVLVVAEFLGAASKAVRFAPPRGAASYLALFLVLSPSSFAALGSSLKTVEPVRHDDVETSTSAIADCYDIAAIHSLRALPVSTLFTPIDYGPFILTQTKHRVTAAPYHRNDVAMRRTIDFFMGDEAAAQRTIDAAGADFVVFCAVSGEAKTYAYRAPSGMAASLAASNPPSWLSPVELNGAGPIEVYRVLRP